MTISLEEVVRPALDAGMVVISDRYVDSTIAYQGAGRALSDDDITRLAWWSVSYLVPDLTVLMDVPPSEGLAVRDNPDRIESAGEDFHERVRQHFLALAAQAPQRYLVVNGRDPKDEVTERIRARVTDLLQGQ